MSAGNAFLRRGSGSISFSWAASLLSIGRLGRLSLTIMISSRQGVYIAQGCKSGSALFRNTHELSRLKMEPRRALDAHKKPWRLKMEHWRVFRPAVADSRNYDEDPDPH
jgi:hypothetical protein